MSIYIYIYIYIYVNTSDIVPNLNTSAPTLLLGKTTRKQQNVCIKNCMEEKRSAAQNFCAVLL